MDGRRYARNGRKQPFLTYFYLYKHNYQYYYISYTTVLTNIILKIKTNIIKLSDNNTIPPFGKKENVKAICRRHVNVKQSTLQLIQRRNLAHTAYL